MKSNVQLSVVIAFLLVAINCKKETTETPDYRDTYIGEWNFTVKSKLTFMDTSGIQTTYDTVNYLGNIQYGVEKNEIAINYLSGNSMICFIDEEGNLTEKKVPGYNSSASFQNSNHITIWHNGGPRYSYLTQSAIGIKKE